MRVEATIPENRGVALKELSAELGMTKSQLIDEALALFLKVMIEARKGRQLVSIGAEGDLPCEIATPSLTQIEWMQSRQGLTLSASAVERMAALIESPPSASAALKAALRAARGEEG